MVTDDKTPKPKKNSAFELVTKEEKRSKTARVQSAKKRIEIPELIKQVLNNIKPFEFPTSSKSGKRKSFLSKEKTQTFHQPEKTSTTFFIQKLRKTSRLEAHLHSLDNKTASGFESAQQEISPEPRSPPYEPVNQATKKNVSTS